MAVITQFLVWFSKWRPKKRGNFTYFFFFLPCFGSPVVLSIWSTGAVLLTGVYCQVNYDFRGCLAVKMLVIIKLYLFVTSVVGRRKMMNQK